VILTLLTRTRLYGALVHLHLLYGSAYAPLSFVVPGGPPDAGGDLENDGRHDWPVEMWGMNLGWQISSIRRTNAHVRKRPDRIRLLDQIGFVWHVDSLWWRYTILGLRVFKKLHNGSMLVPVAFVVEHEDPDWPSELWGSPLGRTVQHLRQKRRLSDKLVAQDREAELQALKRKSRLDEPNPAPVKAVVKYQALRAHIRELDEMGFVWSKADAHWDFMSRQLADGKLDQLAEEHKPASLRKPLDVPTSSLPFTRKGQMLHRYGYELDREDKNSNTQGSGFTKDGGSNGESCGSNGIADYGAATARAVGAMALQTAGSGWSPEQEDGLTQCQRLTIRRHVANTPQRTGDTVLELCEEEEEAWMAACEKYVTESDDVMYHI
jgi:hypothetical protein